MYMTYYIHVYYILYDKHITSYYDLNFRLLREYTLSTVSTLRTPVQALHSLLYVLIGMMISGVVGLVSRPPLDLFADPVWDLTPWLLKT